ncbi:hypothetical protein F2P81_000749 [Scophthalmus maximus]|uniref:Uncharacterized protein n=1 Tax=Scophthalmus maximus TaxID=52904 RepID=A0A6A4THU5_SCOMX|nr:hypothetical protein F2P81_000749 [Scophthalmus maximus]
MLRFMSSFLKSTGEFRGDACGESLGELFGDPPGTSTYVEILCQKSFVCSTGFCSQRHEAQERPGQGGPAQPYLIDSDMHYIYLRTQPVDRRRNCEIGPHLKDSKNTDFVKDIYGSASVSSHSLAEIEQSSDAEHFSMFFMEKEVKKSCEGEFIRVSVSTPLEFTLDYVKCGGGFC